MDDEALLSGTSGTAAGKSRMKGSETAPGALDRNVDVLTGSSQTSTKLEDFELIRVLGKGCAGRVSLLPLFGLPLKGDRSCWSGIHLHHRSEP